MLIVGYVALGRAPLENATEFCNKIGQEETSPFAPPWEGRSLFALRVPVGL
jgi:hypothetical protein